MLGERPSYDDVEFSLDFYTFYTNTPLLLLYADGQLIIRSGVEDLWFKHLEEREICEVLSSIKNAGFLDYDPTTYRYTPFAWDWRVLIQVNAWKTQRVELPGLATWLTEPERYQEVCQGKDDCAPTISESLETTYEFLRNYQINDMLKYQPDRLAIWVAGQIAGSPEYAIDWPLTDYPLSNQWQKYDEPLILDGEAAKRAAALLPYSIGPRVVFSEGQYAYPVTYRPLFPYEEVPTGLKTFYPIPSDNVDTPNVKLTCKVTELSH